MRLLAFWRGTCGWHCTCGCAPGKAQKLARHFHRCDFRLLLDGHYCVLLWHTVLLLLGGHCCVLLWHTVLLLLGGHCCVLLWRTVLMLLWGFLCRLLASFFFDVAFWRLSSSSTSLHHSSWTSTLPRHIISSYFLEACQQVLSRVRGILSSMKIRSDYTHQQHIMMPRLFVSQLCIEASVVFL